ncbi:MAG: hypothetical protein ABJ242_12380 [Marinomonas sp.]
MGMSWKVLLLIIGVATLTLRALLDSEFATTTLVYIAVPFAISPVTQRALSIAAPGQSALSKPVAKGPE